MCTHIHSWKKRVRGWEENEIFMCECVAVVWGFNSQPSQTPITSERKREKKKSEIRSRYFAYINLFTSKHVAVYVLLLMLLTTHTTHCRPLTASQPPNTLSHKFTLDYFSSLSLCFFPISYYHTLQYISTLPSLLSLSLLTPFAAAAAAFFLFLFRIIHTYIVVGDIFRVGNFSKYGFTFSSSREFV